MERSGVMRSYMEKQAKITYSARYARLASDGFSTAYDSTHNNGF